MEKLPDFKRNDIVAFEDLTIETVLDRFLKKFGSQNTRYNYKIDILKFFQLKEIFFLKEIHPQVFPFRELAEHITSYIKSYEKRDPHDERILLNTRTVNRKKYAMQSFFKFLIHEYDYPKNPLFNVQSFRKPKKSDTQEFKLHEIKQLTDYAYSLLNEDYKTHRNFLMISLLYVNALRISELLGLRKDHIDFHNNIIRFYTKGGKVKRFRMSEYMANKLSTYINDYCEGFDFLFRPDRNRYNGVLNKGLSRVKADNILRKIVSEAGLRISISTHSFRVSHITHALDMNISPHKVMGTTGHEDLQMIYYYDRRKELEYNTTQDIENIIRM